MHARAWVRRFEENRKGRPEPDWSRPCPETPRVRALLGRSLAHFQLGESGGGTFLLRGANAKQATREDGAYPQALRLFIGEENEHARLLSHLVARYGAPLLREHWTHFAFHHVRQLAGIDFELQVLVTAELIGNGYYETLLAHTGDETLAEACRLILRDEAMHVLFHLERLHDALDGRPPYARAAWALAFTALFEAALAVAAYDHGAAVAAIGGSRRELATRSRAQRGAFLRSLGLATAPAAAR